MAAVSADSTLDDLERRLAELEFLVGERTSTAEPIAVAVKNIETTLGEKAKELRDLYRQYGKHRHMIDNPMRYASDDLTVALDGMDLVEATAKNLEQLDGLKDNVNPEYLNSVPESMGKLVPLKEVHTQQREGMNETSRKLDELLDAYNSFVMDMSAKFVGIDMTLAKHGH